MALAPIVKWSGSKRSQAEEIVKRFPRDVDTYYEPFCGGCSVLYRLMQTPEIKINRYVVSDLNGDLISLWKEIRDNPLVLSQEYRQLWAEFNKKIGRPDSECFEWRKQFFEELRDEFNKCSAPSYFLFIMRTTTNGMPRYNREGKFNNSCHFSRPGIEPDSLEKIMIDWSHLLNQCKVEFLCRPYEMISPENENDLAYLDPPYFNTKGMYYGKIEFDRYFAWLRTLPCRWAMSFDGRTDKEDFTYAVPDDLYVKHEYLRSGNSSFRRVIGKDRHAEVSESLYLNYEPMDPTTIGFLQGELL